LSKRVALILTFLAFFSCCLLFLCVLLGMAAFLRSPEGQTIWEIIYATPTPTPVPRIVRTPLPEGSTLTEEALARVEVPERDLLALAIRFGRVTGPVEPVVNPTPPRYELGDKEVFWITDQDAKTHFTATATLRYITPHLYMWVEEGFRVDQKALEKSALRFENRIYPTNRYFFGSEWTPGVDNDPHLHVFNGRVPGVGGYYSSADEYPRLANPYSNEKEIFYINLNNATPGTDYYDGILAHEFQHMIHWAVDRNEDTWVNEGLSELASFLNGFDVGGVDLAFSRTPDTQLTSWAIIPSQAGPNYGASYLFMTYFLERLGEEALRELARNPANGVQGFEAVLAPRGLSFDELFADWVVANWLDRPEEDERYGYRDLDPPSPMADQVHKSYPVRRATTVHQYGTDYIELWGQEELLVRFKGSTVAHLADVRPHSGRYMWWSNRADDSDITLTRAFDLEGVDSATLQVWLWYDIEEDWDYAYIEVSTDGGKTWTILPGLYTTDYNPNGNSFGHAYTGKSGARQSRLFPVSLSVVAPDRPHWVRESIDLTPYVGQEVLIRFEYVTDDAVNHPGLFVDDIAIPELGYFDDVESGEGGWEARGFIRTDNLLTQRWLVQFIEYGEEGISVRRMEIEDGKGEMRVGGVRKEVGRLAVMAVSALAPATTELASYEYEVIPVE